MITESNMLQSMSENNRAINEAIEKAMKAKSSQKQMTNIENLHQK